MIETISCLACGKKIEVEINDKTRKMHFKCLHCTREFSIVFNRHKIIEETQRRYALAKDYPGD